RRTTDIVRSRASTPCNESPPPRDVKTETDQRRPTMQRPPRSEAGLLDLLEAGDPAGTPTLASEAINTALDDICAGITSRPRSARKGIRARRIGRRRAVVVAVAATLAVSAGVATAGIL